MQNTFIEYVYLVFIIIALVMVAGKLKLAYPIVLVLGGLALSFAKVFSSITIDPELIFFIFLPPLLYEAAWLTSWKEFWRLRRVITSFAFPVVILTSCVVAFAAHALIPGFTLALGFLLGGIISPPDAISATTIMRQVKVPKTLMTVVEGESLLNDASSLIVFRFALAAVITGQFHFAQAAVSFFMVITAGTLIGIAIGFIFYGIHKWLPVSPSIEIVLSFLAPYCMYYFAERFHFSGVLSVVAGGLLLSNKRDSMLTYQGRVQGANVWSTIGFVLNGIVFLLIGLQLPLITSKVEGVSLGQAIGYGLAISFLLIIVRLLSAFGAAAFTMFIGRFITVADRHPGWKVPLIFGWTGMRGVVSLAAALSVPVLMGNGQPFAYRNLILIITFVVILVTLVLQGLTLPWLIRKINPAEKSGAIPEHQQERIIQKKIAHYSLKYLEEKYGEEWLGNEHYSNLQTRLKTELNFFSRELAGTENMAANSLKDYQLIYLELLDEQRRLLNKINQHAEFDEELIRKYLFLTDMEEFKIRKRLPG
jgi:monovalent cation/hydrogen antiporter